LRAWLGGGGNGTVYSAWDRKVGRSIAIKLFEPARTAGLEGTRRLEREVRLARAVVHENVCPVFDLVAADGHWFMTMELAARTLREDLDLKVESPGETRWARSARDARSVCAGLGAIHRLGIAHGDLTPRNILRMGDGRLALADFGLARGAADEPVTHGGTLNYLAPEVALGLAPDSRSDLWQLGIVLHEILLGARPSWRMTDAGPVACLSTSFDPPCEIAELLAIAAACLAWNPALRPATATDLLGPRSTRA
jgi:serine/threonine-protein kinase